MAFCHNTTPSTSFNTFNKISLPCFPMVKNDEADCLRDYRHPEDELEAVKADGEAGTGVNHSSWSRKWLEIVFHLSIGVRSRMSRPGQG